MVETSNNETTDYRRDSMVRMTGNKPIGEEGKARATEDFYATPSHAVEALMKREQFIGQGWEPACGDGAIVKYFPGIMASDIRTDPDVVGEKGINFFFENRKADFIITNPPFKTAKEFIKHGLDCLNWGGEVGHICESATFGRREPIRGDIQEHTATEDIYFCPACSLSISWQRDGSGDYGLCVVRVGEGKNRQAHNRMDW